MNNNEDRNNKILAIVLVCLVGVVAIYNIFFKGNKQEKIDTKTISVLTDNSRFYTVSSCVSKFLSFLTGKDTDKLYVLLDENYVKENNVTKENIYNFLGTYDNELIFSPKKIFEQRISENIYKYYVKGYISPDIMDSIGEKQDYYIIVIQDQENMTFSIVPYDGKMFK